MGKEELLRSLPSVERLLEHEKLQALDVPRPLVVDAARKTLEEARQAILSGKDAVDIGRLAESAALRAVRSVQRSLVAAVNATGIILHTGLGRAVLPKEACDAISQVARSHCVLEIDRESGRRGSRLKHIEELLCKLTGAEAAAVVNNNAAAVLLAVNTLANGGRVIISRGQLVEIGGSFRIPDVIARGGAVLVEVGTTNRTRISDYESALEPGDSLILRVHASNFRIIGFTEQPTLSELVQLARSAGVRIMDDLGSGALVDMTEFGLGEEPLVQASVAAGCDIVTFSGDKLLGGPQAGIMVGKRDVISRCISNPLYRAVRVDKLTLAGLEATLRLYMDMNLAVEAIPVLRYIRRTPDEIHTQARRLARQLRTAAPAWEIAIVPGFSQVGGGSLPGEKLPTSLIAIKSTAYSADDLCREFRLNDPPIIGRIEKEAFLLDPRTLEQPDYRIIIECARRLGA